MKISAARRRVATIAVGVAALGGFALAAPQGASADSLLCAEGRVWISGSATPVGSCVPLPVVPWPPGCDGFNVTADGTGVGATVCAPAP